MRLPAWIRIGALLGVVAWVAAGAAVVAQSGGAPMPAPAFKADPSWPVLPADWTWGHALP